VVTALFQVNFHNWKRVKKGQRKNHFCS